MALYVGLARAVGLPARDVYASASRLRGSDTESGAAMKVVSKAQHLPGRSVPDRVSAGSRDPADVRKVVLEEPPGKACSRRSQGRSRAQDAVPAPGR